MGIICIYIFPHNLEGKVGLGQFHKLRNILYYGEPINGKPIERQISSTENFTSFTLNAFSTSFYHTILVFIKIMWKESIKWFLFIFVSPDTHRQSPIRRPLRSKRSIAQRPLSADWHTATLKPETEIAIFTIPAKRPHTPMMNRILKTADPTIVPSPTSLLAMNTPETRWQWFSK